MVVLGLLLLAIGVLAGLAAVFSSSGTASFLGADLGAATLFFLGVAATLGRAVRPDADPRRHRSRAPPPA